MHIAVVGSVNLDIVATADRLPRPGETVTGATLARHPGGKGANQALAARRLGADVSLLACVGRDAAAEEALALLRAEGVRLERLLVDPEAATGVALIAVAAGGENQIVVAPGANRALRPESLAASYAALPAVDATICQLEVPMATAVRAAVLSRGLLVVNLAPAMPADVTLLQRAGVLVVNETEAEFYGTALHASPADIVITAGARGASLWRAHRR
jgi:ribokinase